jgi:hypothetical protein
MVEARLEGCLAVATLPREKRHRRPGLALVHASLAPQHVTGRRHDEDVVICASHRSPPPIDPLAWAPDHPMSTVLLAQRCYSGSHCTDTAAPQILCTSPLKSLRDRRCRREELPLMKCAGPGPGGARGVATLLRQVRGRCWAASRRESAACRLSRRPPGALNQHPSRPLGTAARALDRRAAEVACRRLQVPPCQKSGDAHGSSLSGLAGDRRPQRRRGSKFSNVSTPGAVGERFEERTAYLREATTRSAPRRSRE